MKKAPASAGALDQPLVVNVTRSSRPTFGYTYPNNTHLLMKAQKTQRLSISLARHKYLELPRVSLVLDDDV